MKLVSVAFASALFFMTPTTASAGSNCGHDIPCKFSYADLNGDSAVNQAEFTWFVGVEYGEGEAIAAGMFGRGDHNNDGLLTLQEFFNALFEVV